MAKIFKRQECFIKAAESFFDNYPDDMVVISIHQCRFNHPDLPINDNNYHVVVSGNDDFSFRKSFKSRMEAMYMYDELSDKFQKIGITHAYLKDKGFIRC